jgi:hypothetical protein
MSTFTLGDMTFVAVGKGFFEDMDSQQVVENFLFDAVRALPPDARNALYVALASSKTSTAMLSITNTLSGAYASTSAATKDGDA